MTNKKSYNQSSKTVNIDSKTHALLIDFINNGHHDGISITKFSSNAILEKLLKVKEKKEGGFPGEQKFTGFINEQDLDTGND